MTASARRPSEGEAEAPRGAAARHEAAPSRAVQELWFALERRGWSSVVVVPADEGTSAADVASLLADVGKSMQRFPVTLLVMASRRDYASVAAMVRRAADDERGEPDVDPDSYTTSMMLVAQAASPEGSLAPRGRVVVAVQPVVVEPMGLAVTGAADAVVLCIARGRSRMSTVRRTIELIGRERIAGCFLA